MMKQDLIIYYSNAQFLQKSLPGEKKTFAEIVRLAKNREFFSHIRRYENVVFYCPGFTSFPKPFLTAMICKLLSTGRSVWRDLDGREQKITWLTLLGLAAIFLYEYLSFGKFLDGIEHQVTALMKQERLVSQREGQPLYLRCDVSYGEIAGGSLGHIAGVANNLEKLGGGLLFATTDRIPMVHQDIVQHLIRGPVRYANVQDVARVAFNRVVYTELKKLADNKDISFIYQRSALNAYAGIRYALENKIPFVLEYNGSEVWISNHWGSRKLSTYHVSKAIENLNFMKADLITCVSAPLKQQLVDKGISADKIIVNPNCVDTEIYTPAIDGSQMRGKYNIAEGTVIVGFIGTFGAWHGTEILTEAYAKFLEKYQGPKDNRLMLIGDGVRMPAVKKIIRQFDISEKCILTGIVPQNEGRFYLAACDILVIPTVKNPDGSPFFGSPTKMFEYMAMGKAIIASNMDQMAEVLQDNETALLSVPGDADSVASAIARLVDDEKLRKRLGENARVEAVAKYTWEKHVQKIVEALQQRLCPSEAG